MAPRNSRLSPANKAGATNHGSQPRSSFISATSLTFVSKAALDVGMPRSLGLNKTAVAVENCCNVGKTDMIHNRSMPDLTVDPETYEVRADGELLTCEPAQTLPLAQRYFLF